MFWWDQTGPILAQMMALAGYDSNSQHRNLLFYYVHIATALGRKPTPQGQPAGWRSFMTDDYSPLEFSWDWNRNGSSAKPKVRFSMEPIGRYAGSTADPLNEHMALELVESLRPTNMKGLDLTLFTQLHDELTTTRALITKSGGWSAKKLVDDHRSQVFLAFDLGNEGPVLKAYFLPGLKALQMGMTIDQLVADAISRASLLVGPQLWHSFERLRLELGQFPEVVRPKTEIISIDCTEPRDSRFKIYLRSPETSFKSVIRMLSAASQTALNDRDVGEFRELWTMLFEPHDLFDETDPLPALNHRTSGMLYYFELRPTTEDIVAKVYLPVRHYAKSDLVVARSLEAFLQSRGNGIAMGQYTDQLSQIL